MRALTDNEAQILVKVLGSLSPGEGLARQVSLTRASDDSIPTYLRLTVDGEAAAADILDGPIPGRFPVLGGGELVGEVMVWVKGGRLAALEFAWVTDVAPTQMPDVDDVSID